MNSETLVNAVKEGLGTGPNYPSGVIEHYIGEVKAYLAAAGVPETVMNSDEVIGIIVREWMISGTTAACPNTFIRELSNYHFQEVNTYGDL